MTILPQATELLPGVFVTASDLFGGRAAREDVVQPEAEDGGWLQIWKMQLGSQAIPRNPLSTIFQ